MVGAAMRLEDRQSMSNEEGEVCQTCEVHLT